MKRKGSRKSQKPEDDSNGLKEHEENGGRASEPESDPDDEPQDKKKRSSKLNKRNVSFSKKGDKSPTETDDEDLRKSKDKKKKKEAIVEEDSDEIEQDEDDDSQYEVEKVLDEKMIRGVRHYLIRWKGYEEESDTWERDDSLNCQDLIKAYNESKKRHKGKKGVKKDKKREEENWDENEDFEVDKILEVHHRKDGKREFFVSWKGYSQKYNSWEPEDNMSCQDLIKKFMEKVEKAKSFEDRDLRVDRKRVQRLTYNTPDSNRRLSKRNSGKERVQYHDTE